ncbi:hypothetical protein [Opitutus terrae]|uniref:Uncharacterized protein n=1 Tax=Opitutus terrae (strain DSM 11246 / JCM 15787 / PB90-1) TaxID=452637 RepID=B1ZUB5_OPITP|nr:hypothetical protein [Opitutus terrae]ACB76677.1 hypothetical protein Oter_3400 [Opitutus terrae PB90-1]
MTVLRPREIPQQLGMIAARVLVPELPIEIHYAAARPGLPIWRITVWQDGRAWFALWQSEVLLKPEGFAFVRRAHPDRWVEVTQPQPTP